MNKTSTTTTASSRANLTCLPGNGVQSFARPKNGPADRTSEKGAIRIRTMQPVRFAMGLMISAAGIGMILSVALGMFQIRKFGGDMSLLIVAFVVLLGVMFLGGGFGVMATSSAGFDESEFDRLSSAGNLSAEYDSMFTADMNSRQEAPALIATGNSSAPEFVQTPAETETNQPDAA